MIFIYTENAPNYDKKYAVQVFGSCHSYTSFNPIKFEEDTGISAYVYGNPGEIIPTTYVRMYEQFKKNLPKVALVEIWGINPYETYDTQSRIFGNYLERNLEILPLSLKKNEVIKDFSLDMIEMNSVIYSYKNRLLDGTLKNLDFDYDFAKVKEYTSDYVFSEMSKRLIYNGYKKNPSRSITDYPKRQAYVGKDDIVQIEWDIVKYINKIIRLCKEKSVELIFYRSPYISQKNELKKLNHLNIICEENNILFINLEDEISYNYTNDFLDYEHLSEIGANKSTEFLEHFILEKLNCDITNRQLDSDYVKQSDDYKLYIQDSFTLELNATNDSEKYLELLTSKKEATDNTCIFVVKTSEKNINSKYFNSLGINVNSNNCIAIIDEGKVVYNRTASDILLQHEYKIGRLPVKIVSDVKSNASSIKVDGIEQIKNKSGITLVIYDKLLKKVSSVRSL